MANSSDTKIVVSTTNAPAANGPYSQAVRVGNLVFTAGQIPADPQTQNFVPGGIREQTARVIENIQAILVAAGTDLNQVVKTSVFLQNMDDFGAMNEVYATYFAPEGVVPPARSTVQVAALPRKAMVEIEAIALIPEKV